ncbi:MAG: rod shape-determining protein MreC [Patescibacteria group bacterium]|nr:rod shape-determining protein MreC [Patescibacteria group bacterium]
MKRIFFFTVLIAAIILLYILGILTPVENIILKTATPVGNVFRGFFGFFDNTYQKFLSGKDFEEENKRLRERIKELIAERVELDILQEENTSLKKMLSFLDEKNYENVTARVVGKTAEGDISAIIINKGKRDGITNNLPVITKSGILIGKIIKVTQLTSTVLLLSDGNSKIAGMVQNSDKTIGLIKGGYGLGVRMELIPQTEIIETDEIVITSGAEPEIPKGLLIGTVESTVKEPHTPFQTVIIKPLVDYDKIDIVSILIL